jgi:hypothetical protein
MRVLHPHLSHGSPQRISYRTLSSILSQLCTYFKDQELFPDSMTDREQQESP